MVQDLVFNLAWSGFSLLFVAVGVYTAYQGRKQRARGERIADTETTPIRDLQPGTVEIKGTANPAADATVVASPITRTDALATHVEVEEWEQSGQGGGSWDTIHEAKTGTSIAVDDGTGEVRIDIASGMELNLERARTEVDSGDQPPEAIRQYVESESDIDEATRHEFGPLSVGDRRRYSEGVIEPGEAVYVLGAVHEERAGWGEREYVMDEPTDAGDFVLSDKSEADLIQEGKRSGLVQLAFGGVLAVVGTAFSVYPWLAA